MCANKPLIDKVTEEHSILISPRAPFEPFVFTQISVITLSIKMKFTVLVTLYKMRYNIFSFRSFKQLHYRIHTIIRIAIQHLYYKNSAQACIQRPIHSFTIQSIDAFEFKSKTLLKKIYSIIVID